jgi:hypothetical protein
MKILEIKVDTVPEKCSDCLFYNHDGYKEEVAKLPCNLKYLLGYETFGISLRPCPLDGIMRNREGLRDV